MDQQKMKRAFAIGAVILLIVVVYYYMSLGNATPAKAGCGCNAADPASGFVPAPNVEQYDLGNGVVITPTGTFNSADQYAIRYSP